jgi:methylase of polypeptide subunit release factors
VPDLLDLDLLRADLVSAGYTLDGVQSRLGDQALAALARNTTAAARRVLGGDTDPQADAIRLWLLQLPVPATRLSGWSALPGLLERGLLVAVGDDLRATVELKPHGSTARQGWICSDPVPLDGRLQAPRADFVLGASPASTTLAQLVPQRHFGRVLDLGTGCGIQAMHLDADEIVATDLNPRALELAAISLGLSGVRADLRAGSLYEPVAGERFDLILTNPPYVIAPPGGALVYREGGLAGDDLMREVVTGAAGRLTDGGSLVVLGNWAHLAGEPWQERLASWLAPTGCDALVVQRELLDPYEYIEIWLADAGLQGTDDYDRTYGRWLDYFEALGITGVGLGWVLLRNAGREQPDVRFEDWPHQVAQPVGDALARHFDAVAAARSADSHLLAARLRCAPDVTQETYGLPGAADPQHIVLRQATGLCRAVAVDTALAAVVGACDGDLPLGDLLDAVAGLLDVDPAALAADLLPRLRTLLADGLLEFTASHRNPTGSALETPPTLEVDTKEQ